MNQILNSANISRRLIISILTIAIISGIYVPYAAAEDLDRSSINDLLKRRDNILNSLNTPSNGYEKESRERASKIMEKIYSDDFQKQLQIQTEKLKNAIFKDHAWSLRTAAGSNGDKEVVSASLLPDERLYVFVSSSVPIQTLRNYAASIDKIGDPRIVMVMRGFVGGMKDWTAMLDFSSRVLVKNPSCDTRREQCETYAANLQVDPLLFRRFGVSLVPSIVYARGVNRKDPLMSEGLSEIAEISGFYSIQGDMSFEYFLETIRQETESRSIDGVLAVLRGSHYDGK